MSTNLFTLDIIRTGVALAMLGYGSVKDLRIREVHDLLWVVGGGVGLVLDVYELFLGTLSLQQLAFSVGFMVAVGLVLSYLRLFGGADLLAFIALSIIHPKAPVYLLYNWGWSPPFYPFTIISNTALAGIVTPLVALTRNLGTVSSGTNLFERHQDVSTMKKAALMLTAVNVGLIEVRGPPYQYPLEEPEGEIRLRPDIWDDERAVEVFKIFREEGIERIWVSSTLPYLILITIGYLLSVVLGDLILWFFVIFS